MKARRRMRPRWSDADRPVDVSPLIPIFFLCLVLVALAAAVVL